MSQNDARREFTLKREVSGSIRKALQSSGLHGGGEGGFAILHACIQTCRPLLGALAMSRWRTVMGLRFSCLELRTLPLFLAGPHAFTPCWRGDAGEPNRNGECRRFFALPATGRPWRPFLSSRSF